MFRHVQRWALPRARHRVESLGERVEALGRCAAASWADVFLDRHLAEPTKLLCGGCDRAVGPGALKSL